MTKKSYTELIQFKTYEERLNYLKCKSTVGDITFGGSRWMNQVLYKSDEWLAVRNDVIIRDDSCDLGLKDYELCSGIYIHHINPITKEQVLERDPEIFSMDNLICVSFNTHQAIHYGDDRANPYEFIERTHNDHCPWKR